MSKTNSWLCTYAVAQLGKPYKMGYKGTFKKCTQKKYRQYKHKLTSENDWHKNPYYDEEVKHHDCAGLVVGAVTCSGVNSKPSVKKNKKGQLLYPISGGASSMWKNNCKNKHTTMLGFDKIPGRLVFEFNTKKNKDKYMFSHVGIYVGTFKDSTGTHKDAVIEALGKKFGVVYSDVSNKKWGAWAQLSICKEDTSVNQVFTATGGGVNPQSLINVKNIDPYAITIGPSQTNVDFAKLKQHKVAIVMLNAGSLFDATHKKKTYINPNLDSQVLGCMSANLPFALYADVRAHNEIDADAECNALYYVLARHSPPLGIWLRLDTQQSVAINNKIIDIYYKYIEKWGLVDRCGFYVDISKLANFTWGDYQEKFYLWGIDTNIDFKKVEGKLLQPSMFEVK